ncbi:hypothetical protein MLD38_014358 [Melastoma candidum]|uniref:Uncharacterized protein n=1 Tax=Melastoma candidum TaxID=119954 RepID=A0ACB9REE9_9MYRT|nr:hypothetical protein MLD38_014358 [Melastoma candidum]
MENRFKARISRMFHNSCKSRDDIVDKSPLLTRSASMPAAPPPMPLPRPSICKPRVLPSLHVNKACFISSNGARRFVAFTHKNGASPREPESKPKSKAISPVSPVKHFSRSPFGDRGGMRFYAMDDDYGNKKKGRNMQQATPSCDDHHFSCRDYQKEDKDEEEEEDERTMDTLFSSMSLSSSESSENHCRISRSKTVGRATHQRKELREDSTGVGGSFAVVKKSRDPLGDFRRSMMDMIVEREIFDEEGLEKLLSCFLSLNSSRHHDIIVQAFNEIWDALFTNTWNME